MNSGDKRQRKFSPQEKSLAVLRLLRGEPVESIAEELGVRRARLDHWHTTYTSAGFEALLKESTRSRLQRLEKRFGKALPWVGLLLALTVILVLLQRMFSVPHE
jgi:transposase-like protein